MGASAAPELWVALWLDKKLADVSRGCNEKHSGKVEGSLWFWKRYPGSIWAWVVHWAIVGIVIVVFIPLAKHKRTVAELCAVILQKDAENRVLQLEKSWRRASSSCQHCPVSDVPNKKSALPYDKNSKYRKTPSQERPPKKTGVSKPKSGTVLESDQFLKDTLWKRQFFSFPYFSSLPTKPNKRLPVLNTTTAAACNEGRRNVCIEHPDMVTCITNSFCG